MKNLVRTGSVALLLACPGVLSAALTIEVRDARGAPLEGAVVTASPRSPMTLPKGRKEATIEQKNRQFAPFLTVIQANTQVQFPNRDDVRHHVYSFSPAKTFEIKLYVGTPAAPVVFDKPGEVILGCNIHDHMRAYVYVVDTPFHALTDADGRVVLDNLPAGEFELGVWHHAQGAASAKQRVRLRAGQNQRASFAVVMKPAAR
jgi:plastocyanin